MIKMLIELNNKLIENDGYSIEMMWSEIDSVFDNIDCTKNIIDNNTVMYESNPNKHSNIGDLYTVYSGITRIPYFLIYATKWTVFENIDDASLPLSETDALSIAKKYKKIK